MRYAFLHQKDDLEKYKGCWFCVLTNLPDNQPTTQPTNPRARKPISQQNNQTTNQPTNCRREAFPTAYIHHLHTRPTHQRQLTAPKYPTSLHRLHAIPKHNPHVYHPHTLYKSSNYTHFPITPPAHTHLHTP